MFTELVAEKISSTVCKGLWKEQKRNSDVYQAECRKGKADDYLAKHRYHAIEKTKQNSK
jgi:hypothetical protein